MKVIIFASNTFSNSDKSYELFAKEFNLSEKDLIKINKKYFLPAKKGKYSKSQLIEKLAKELKSTKKRILENVKDCGNLMKTDMKIMGLVKKLKKDYRVVVVSNTNELFASLPIEKGQYNNFDLAVLSYKIGVLRPEVNPYREILKRLKVSGSDCIYVDRKERMLTPAEKLGMKTVLYKGIGDLKKKLGEMK